MRDYLGVPSTERDWRFWWGGFAIGVGAMTAGILLALLVNPFLVQHPGAP